MLPNRRSRNSTVSPPHLEEFCTTLLNTCKASFVIWAADEVLRVAGRDGPEESFTLLKALAARVAAALGGFVATLEDGAVTVDIFSRLERLSIALEACSHPREKGAGAI